MHLARILTMSLALFALSACATTILDEGEKAQIVEVTVTKASPDIGSANLAEAVRYKTQNVAYRYSEEGPEHTLNLNITDLRITDPITAFLLSGQSYIYADATLTDKASGKSTEPFLVGAVITGFGGVVGAAMSAGVDRFEYEQRLSGMLAEQAMDRIYGGDHTERVANRKPKKEVSPQYPVSYAEARRDYECRQIIKKNESVRQDAAQANTEPDPILLTDVPAHCKGDRSQK